MAGGYSRRGGTLALAAVGASQTYAGARRYPLRQARPRRYVSWFDVAWQLALVVLSVASVAAGLAVALLLAQQLTRGSLPVGEAVTIALVGILAYEELRPARRGLVFQRARLAVAVAFCIFAAARIASVV